MSDNVLCNSSFYLLQILVSLLYKWKNWGTEGLCHLTKLKSSLKGRTKNCTRRVWLQCPTSIWYNSVSDLWVLKYPLLSLILRVLLFSYSPISLYYSNAWDVFFPMFFVALIPTHPTKLSSLNLFFFNNFIYLFMFGCAECSLLCGIFSSCGKQGLLSGCCECASHCSGFFCCGAHAQRVCRL